MYKNCYFSGSGLFTEFTTGDQIRDSQMEAGNATVFVELPDQRRFLLSELSEQKAIEILKASKMYADEGVFNNEHFGKDQDYSDSYSSFTYRKGMLVYANLHRTSKQFRISPNKDGPYLSFPIQREKLIEVFGEPIEWRHIKPPSGP